MINLNYLESIRLLELESILPEIKRDKPGRCNVLEIGAGAGWQSKKLAENGYFVEAIDVDSSGYSMDRVWPVINYDGKHIPFPDEYFDIVFSSNVLEHIPYVIAFQDEINRVLKTDGICVHVVPSGNWRFWTSVAHYAHIIKTIINLIIKKKAQKTNEMENRVKVAKRSIPQLLSRWVFPPRHGEVGTALTELYYFSKYRWVNVFTITNWKIEKVFTNRLFYTGYVVLGPALSLQSRRRLSYILGSSCHIFVLRKVSSGIPVKREGPLL